MPSRIRILPLSAAVVFVKCSLPQYPLYTLPFSFSFSELLSPPCIFFLAFSPFIFPLPELFISSPYTVVYAVVSACCFHVCFFARVSFTALPPLSLPSVSLLLLLVTSSCASYSRQVCFICITNQPRASENLRKATYFTFLYHLPPSISFPSSSCLLTLLSFTLYPPAFLHTCKPRISLTVLRDCLLAALTLPASSFRIRIQKSSLHINPASLFPLSPSPIPPPHRTSFSFSHVAIKNHREKKRNEQEKYFLLRKNPLKLEIIYIV